jgi:hypothetical protein
VFVLSRNRFRHGAALPLSVSTSVGPSAFSTHPNALQMQGATRMPSNNRRLFILPLHLLTCHITESSYPLSIGCWLCGIRTFRNGEDGLRNYCLKETAHTGADVSFFVKKLQKCLNDERGRNVGELILVNQE